MPRPEMPAAARVPTVLVTDAGRGSAVAFIRSLGRRGWRVIAADSEPGSAGLRSRYASERLIYPLPETRPQEFVGALRQAACAHQVDLILPITDAAILPLSAARSQFDGICRLALPDADALAVAADKQQTLALAERLQVPVPRTCLVSTVDEAREQGPALGWPLVLKPQTSRLYRDRAAIESYTVCYAENCDDLAARMRRFEGRCPVLLQEYYSGIGNGVELLLHEGRPLAGFQHRRLREVPVSGGASAFRESVPLDPMLYDYAVRMLRELRWTGLAMVEFKVGTDGAKLMEINGRVWGSLPLAVRSGMDFPARLADLCLFGPPAPDQPVEADYRVGVRSRNLALDMVWIASVLLGRRRYPFLPLPPRHQGFVALLQLFNPAYKSDVASLTDPAPLLAEIGALFGHFGSKLKEGAR